MIRPNPKLRSLIWWWLSQCVLDAWRWTVENPVHAASVLVGIAGIIWSVWMWGGLP